MKNRISTFMMALCFGLFTVALTSCGEEGKDGGDGDAKVENKGGDKKVGGKAESQFGKGKNAALGKEYTSAYVCPMHCKGSGGAKMASCDACGMELVTRAEHEADGHTHGDKSKGHGHEHGDGDYDHKHNKKGRHKSHHDHG